MMIKRNLLNCIAIVSVMALSLCGCGRTEKLSGKNVETKMADHIIVDENVSKENPKREDAANQETEKETATQETEKGTATQETEKETAAQETEEETTTQVEQIDSGSNVREEDEAYQKYIQQIHKSAIEKNSQYVSSKIISVKYPDYYTNVTAYYEKYAIADLNADGVNELILYFELWEGEYKNGEMSTGTENGYYYSIYQYNGSYVECVTSFRIFSDMETDSVQFYVNGTYSEDGGGSYCNLNADYFLSQGIVPELDMYGNEYLDLYQFYGPRIYFSQIEDGKYMMGTTDGIGVGPELKIITASEYEQLMKKIAPAIVQLMWQDICSID
ncbi:MAG: hypothetical protein II919_08315 [Lachnospiraceae bacterium]|nr:hypothetical protein [Lachnospiraceae bacterium]